MSTYVLAARCLCGTVPPSSPGGTEGFSFSLRFSLITRPPQSSVPPNPGLLLVYFSGTLNNGMGRCANLGCRLPCSPWEGVPALAAVCHIALPSLSCYSLHGFCSAKHILFFEANPPIRGCCENRASRHWHKLQMGAWYRASLTPAALGTGRPRCLGVDGV